ncbi:MAG: hypothetical protein KF851_01685 [Pirellulaceae bacterium]|nr:hypothetical protein [Pirellulaceae bacterium]
MFGFEGEGCLAVDEDRLARWPDVGFIGSCTQGGAKVRWSSSPRSALGWEMQAF